MTDPLTYLDEVDALAASLAEENWAEADGAVVNRAGFIRTDLPALSKALRAVLELHHRDRDGDCVECWRVRSTGGNDGGDLPTHPCPTVQAIQAALAVNDEGGKR